MALIRLKEVKQYTGLGRSSIYKFMAEGRFPKSVSLGERAIAWVDTEVEDWVQEKIEQRDENQQGATVSEVKPLKDEDVIAWIKDKLKQNSVGESIEWLVKIIS
ncbi:helix-turn-helix transcriptional regulator [Colwellia sp. 20A7]|uniref:helix-turn-helix transcriptional regulator n=1 Tax=Colwellia sp. 20A7 TaxID=2689569 RepID=UPI00135A5A82